MKDEYREGEVMKRGEAYHTQRRGGGRERVAVREGRWCGEAISDQREERDKE